MIDYYQVLGLTRSAGIKEIKAAYRRMALRYHPDRNQGSLAAEEHFKEISQAYRILSDPDKKFFYDLSLNQPAYIQTPPPTRASAPRRRTARYRPPAMVDPRIDRIGNMWALGFLFFTIILTIASTAVNSHFERKRQQEMLQKNILLFEDARRDFHNGRYKAAIVKMNNMNFIYARDKDVFSFKEEIFRKVRSVAKEHFQQGAYWSALSYYRLLVENLTYVDKEAYYQIAECHRELGNFEAAINVLKEVAANGMDKIENHVKIAGIYKNNLQDYYYALVHYQEALNMIEAQYAGMYGKAFAVVMNASRVPDIHYDAYLGYAESLAYFGDYDGALSAYDWAIHLRPQNPQGYLLKGFCTLKRNDSETACECFNNAARLGSEEGETKVKEYCK